MPRYRVHDHAQLPHNGDVLPGGSIIELPRWIGAELSHLVAEVDEAGDLVQPPAAWQIALETARDHERADVLKAERARLVARIAVVDAECTQAAEVLATAQAQHDALREQLSALETALNAPDPEPAHQPAPVSDEPQEGRSKSRRGGRPAAPEKPAAQE